MSYIITEINDQIAWITINRPESLNAMNPIVIAELEEALNNCIEKPSVGVIILTGSGDKSFVAGADIKTMQTMSSEEALNFGKVGQKLTVTIENSPKPVIAAVNGFA